MRDETRRYRFERLARPELDAMFRTARRLVTDQALAQEIVQEACLRAYQHFRVEEEPEQFRPWLFRIMINLAVDHLRRRGREAGLPVDANPDAMLAVSDPAPSSSPLRGLESRELGREIGKAIDELSIDLRAVVLLVLVEEMSYDEAATSLSISEDLVRSRLGRARERLRKRLSGLAVESSRTFSSEYEQSSPGLRRRPA